MTDQQTHLRWTLPTPSQTVAAVLAYYEEIDATSLSDLNDPDVWDEIAERMDAPADAAAWAINCPAQFATAWPMIADEVAEWERCFSDEFGLIAAKAWTRMAANLIGELIAETVDAA